MVRAWRRVTGIRARVNYPCNAVFASHCERIPADVDAWLNNRKTRHWFWQLAWRHPALHGNEHNECAWNPSKRNHK